MTTWSVELSVYSSALTQLSSAHLSLSLSLTPDDECSERGRYVQHQALRYITVSAPAENTVHGNSLHGLTHGRRFPLTNVRFPCELELWSSEPRVRSPQRGRGPACLRKYKQLVISSEVRGCRSSRSKQTCNSCYKNNARLRINAIPEFNCAFI